MDSPTGESILQEAHRLTHGPRGADYGHPLDDYTRTAALMSAMLAHILKRPLTAHEAALCMCCVKLSREMHVPKRDNMTDLAGYAWVAHACLEETDRRRAAAIKALDTVSDDPIWRAAQQAAEAHAAERPVGARRPDGSPYVDIPGVGKRDFDPAG